MELRNSTIAVLFLILLAVSVYAPETCKKALSVDITNSKEDHTDTVVWEVQLNCEGEFNPVSCDESQELAIPSGETKTATCTSPDAPTSTGPHCVRVTWWDGVGISSYGGEKWECTETPGPNKDLCYGLEADYSAAACSIADFKGLLIHSNKIQICTSKEESWLNENVFGDPDNGDAALNGVKAARYDAAVQLIWNKLDAMYDSGPGECSDDGSTAPDEILDGACGNCVSWSNTLFGLIRSIGVGPDRVKKIGLYTAISPHAVMVYKTDDGNWNVMDMTGGNAIFEASSYESSCPAALKCKFTIDITADDVAPQMWIDPSYDGGQSLFGGFCEGKKFLLFSKTLTPAILSPSEGQEFDEADTVSFEQGTLTTDPNHACFWSVSCLSGTHVTMHEDNCDVFQKVAGDLESTLCSAYDVKLYLMDISTNPTRVGCNTIEIDID